MAYAMNETCKIDSNQGIPPPPPDMMKVKDPPQPKPPPLSQNSKLTHVKQEQKTLPPPLPPLPKRSTHVEEVTRAEYGAHITLLHVAEKPSIASAVAKALGQLGSGFVTRGEKGSCPVHDIKNVPFPKAPKSKSSHHKVTSVTGHVFSTDFPAKYQNWDSVDPAELFSAPIVKKPTKGGTLKHLQREAKHCDFLVLWMDCDREGENINFEVMDVIKGDMKGSKGDGMIDRVYRAHFSAIMESDIQKAYRNLIKPDELASMAVDARQELDLKVGVAFSRFQTRFFQGRYGDLDSSVISYGPCQTPTLGFCVKRHIDIETFKPEPYWLLSLAVSKQGWTCRASWSHSRCFNRKKVENFVERCEETSPTPRVRVTKVATQDKKQGRPVPLNTVGLLKACSKSLGIGPHSAMQTAERLYLSGYVSYPRTESTAYPKSFDFNGTLRSQCNDTRWGQCAKTLLNDGFNVAKSGVDMGDHPPITPCRAAGFGELFGEMERVYELIVRHFLSTISQDAIWRKTRVDLEVDPLSVDGKFYITGKTLQRAGFLAVLLHKQYGDEDDEFTLGEDEEEEHDRLPDFKEGEVLPLLTPKAEKSYDVSGVGNGRLDYIERMTTPPDHLSESELITLMEKNGIGTDASIPTHIENIMKRNYAELVTGRRVRPTKLGIVLGQVLPQVRADIENQCDSIAKGLAHKDTVVKDALTLFEGKFEYFVKHIERMDILFSSSFAKLKDAGRPWSRCGLTRKYLQYIEGPPPRLYNKWTETVYSLPIGGAMKQWNGRICSMPDCNFEVLLYSVGNPIQTFPLCPFCFNEQNKKEEEEEAAEEEEEGEEENGKPRKIAGRALTLTCPLADNHPGIKEWEVCPDPEGNGVLILDPTGGPKWKLLSTRTSTVIFFPASVQKVVLLKKVHEFTGSRYIEVTFKDGQSPLESKEATYKGCFLIDPILQGFVKVLRGDDRLRGGGRGRGRGGRGRGGRGRGGRGRGRESFDAKMSFHGF